MRTFALIITTWLLMAGAVVSFTDLMLLSMPIAHANQSWVKQEHMDTVSRVTRAHIPPGSRGGERPMVITAYTSDDWPDNPAYGITKSGHVLSDKDAWKVAAADPLYYPTGTKIYISGVGVVTVLDTGVEGPERLDLFVGMTAVDVARAWGVRSEIVRCADKYRPFGAAPKKKPWSGKTKTLYAKLLAANTRADNAEARAAKAEADNVILRARLSEALGLAERAG
jgi:3D (Asp-Asp-Asp) domain-containing protein